MKQRLLIVAFPTSGKSYVEESLAVAQVRSIDSDDMRKKLFPDSMKIPQKQRKEGAVAPVLKDLNRGLVMLANSLHPDWQVFLTNLSGFDTIQDLIMVGGLDGNAEIVFFLRDSPEETHYTAKLRWNATEIDLSTAKMWVSDFKLRMETIKLLLPNFAPLANSSLWVLPEAQVLGMFTSVSDDGRVHLGQNGVLRLNGNFRWADLDKSLAMKNSFELRRWQLEELCEVVDAKRREHPSVAAARLAVVHEWIDFVGCFQFYSKHPFRQAVGHMPILVGADYDMLCSSFRACLGIKDFKAIADAWLVDKQSRGKALEAHIRDFADITLERFAALEPLIGELLISDGQGDYKPMVLPEAVTRSFVSR